MLYQIKEWNQLLSSYSYNDTLLIGNGASIAVSNKFKYKELFLHAKEKNFISYKVQNIFDEMKCDNNFELVLSHLGKAKAINNILGAENEKLSLAYSEVRSALIKTVRDIHPEYCEVENQFRKIFNFIKMFKTIISLNYDLIIYWAVLYGNKNVEDYFVKDCFYRDGLLHHGGWKEMRKPYTYLEKHVSILAYPHGNLVLGQNLWENYKKLHASDYHSGLLETILNYWEDERYTPLFVSEGEMKGKMFKIKSNQYLSVVFDEILPEKKENLVIYGWGIGENDEHILGKLSESKLKKVAISVLNNDQEYCRMAYNKISKFCPTIEDIEFFHSNSSGCWNNN